MLGWTGWPAPLPVCLTHGQASCHPVRPSPGSVWSCQVFIKDLCTFSNKAKASCYCVQHLQ